MKDLKITGIGEILWDVYPDYKRIGGAPSNFAYYINKLGFSSTIASRIGDDKLGKEIINLLNSFKISTEYIQIDPQYPTGTVSVTLDDDNNPSYIINEEVAWDFIELSEKWQNLAKETYAVCFGTLSQRTPRSRDTIINFLNLMKENSIKIYDMNLRQHFYSRNTIIRSLETASILKTNEYELKTIRELLDLEGDSEISDLKEIIKKYDIDLVCCTKGENGSIMVTEDECFNHPGYKIKVKDTVGAGDAFTAAMAVEYLNCKDLEKISIKANKLGSLASTFSGPMLNLSSEKIQDYLQY